MLTPLSPLGKQYSLLEENRHGLGDGGLVNVFYCDSWHLKSIKSPFHTLVTALPETLPARNSKMGPTQALNTQTPSDKHKPHAPFQPIFKG